MVRVNAFCVLISNPCRSLDQAIGTCQEESAYTKFLQTFSFLLHSFENWSKKPKDSEAEKMLLENNMVSRNIASSSSFTSGRKIDLLVANEDGDELAFCEFKANNNTTLIQHQQSKSLRLNQQILMKMKRRSLNEQLIFFNGKGNFGRFVVLEETGEIYCSRPSSAFIVSHNILQLDDDTIKAFISWKLSSHHLETFVAGEQEVGCGKQQARERRCGYLPQYLLHNCE
ncbi:uncharacterized protein B0P05DRAFT_571406 [Gilbertella persicaria]|uniref:uncharacterized protein n=1 Tax=Gilbertella persicaria TaxID=101096 RepID=UPI00221EE504|nr:uncharacterized protein B0P05DRAFT_571406 [Gilbertella persicaria]KAI8080282.1 hypothetical protein B0P05DRAFT_571406 [Gilbertella persicaria]